MSHGKDAARDLVHGRRGGRWAPANPGDPRTIAEIMADQPTTIVTDPPPSLFDVPVDATFRHVGHNHPQTAVDMQARALPRSGTFKADMYARIVEMGGGGQSDYDLEDHFRRSHQSVSACRHALMVDGWIAAQILADGTVRTRTNRYGNEATVWVAAPQENRQP